MCNKVESRVGLATLLLLLFSTFHSQASLLGDHPSPYLSLHAEDPVAWKTWSSEIFEQAREQNKLVFVSIGYFACHWCHVMQRESYSDPQIGDYIRQHFIPVKVDRELRPELDRRLLHFVEQVQGAAGWPLNAFITPDGYPVTGFTYLPPGDFQSVLKRLDSEWSQRGEEIKAIAKAYFQQSEYSETQVALVTLPDKNRHKVLDAFVAQCMLIADDLQGGFGNTSKFPNYPQLDGLLQAVRLGRISDTEVFDFIHLTLDGMAQRNLMDHVNDGFFRYTTDPDWHTPHFEKMLYDNAQLAALYLDADQIWPEKGYAEIGLRTLDFIENFLSSRSGGYFASLSAVDEQAVEGGAYYWEAQQLREALGDTDYQFLKQQVGFSDAASNVLLPPINDAEDRGAASSRHLRIRTNLRNAKRPTMPTDDKKLAAWNALVIKALVKALPSGGARIERRLAKQIEVIEELFITRSERRVDVIRFAGLADGAETTLEDYAQIAHALRLYADASENEKKAKQAASLSLELVNSAVALFLKDGRWMKNTSSLIPGDIGQYVLQDKVLQSPQALLLETILLTDEAADNLKSMARQQIQQLTRDMLDTPYHYASAILLYERFADVKKSDS